MAVVPFSKFNGLNEADAPEELIFRSHKLGQNGFTQASGVESPDLINCDLTPDGIRQRKGSTVSSTTLPMLSADVLVAATDWQSPTTGQNIKVIVSTKTIYKYDSTSGWVQINNEGGAAFTHASQTVTRATFAKVDGHLFIGTNGGSNPIQVYKTGDDLDDPMVAANWYESAYGGASKAITGVWPVGAYLLEVLHDRLVYSKGNTLVEASPPAYTPASGIWDGTNAKFKIATGDLRSLTTYGPQYTNSVNQVLYAGSADGMEIIPGFGTNDGVFKVAGTESPLNHQAIAPCLNWLVYLTRNSNILGINGNRVIDLGRRAKTFDKDGVLDKIDIEDSEDFAFGFYHARKKQAMIFFDRTDATVENDTALVLDFNLGEPQIGEPVDSYERRVAILHWRSAGMDDHWFGGIWQNQDSTSTVEAFTAATNGPVYVLDSGDDDFADTAIDGYWYSPLIDGAALNHMKQWLALNCRTIAQSSGTAELDFTVYLDRNANESKTFSFALTNPPLSGIDGGMAETSTFTNTVDGGDSETVTWAETIDGGEALFIDTTTGIGISETGITKRKDDLLRRSEVLQFKFENSTLAETWTLINLMLRYTVGAIVEA